MSSAMIISTESEITDQSSNFLLPSARVGDHPFLSIHDWLYLISLSHPKLQLCDFPSDLFIIWNKVKKLDREHLKE